MWKRSSIPFIHNGRPLVMAHRGDSANVAENTLPAFEDGYKLHVDCLETDVRLTKDNEFVFMHDPTVNRTTNAKGKVLAYTLAELKAMDAGYQFQGAKKGEFPFRGKGLQICTLDEIVPKYPDVRFNMDIKNTSKEKPEAPKLLAEKLKSLNLEPRVQVGSFNQDQIIEFRKHSSAVTSAGLKETWQFRNVAQQWLKDPLNRIKINGQDVEETPLIEAKTLQQQLFGYELPYVSLTIPGSYFNLVSNDLPAGFYNRLPFITPILIRFAHMLNIAVYIWTVNTEFQMHKLLSWGVDGLFTDRPGVMIKLLNTLKNW